MIRKSGSGRAPEVARPYAQTTFRPTTRTGAGIVGINSARNLTRRTTLHHQATTEGGLMGDKMQRVKGKANETMGKAKGAASKRKGSDSTGSGGWVARPPPPLGR